MEKEIINFLNFIKEDKKLSDNTFQSYKRDISQFKEYIDEENIDYKSVKQPEIEGYLTELKKIGKKPSTVLRHLASIRLFYQYLNNQSLKKLLIPLFRLKQAQTYIYFFWNYQTAACKTRPKEYMPG